MLIHVDIGLMTWTLKFQLDLFSMCLPLPYEWVDLIRLYGLEIENCKIKVVAFKVIGSQFQTWKCAI